MRKTKIVCTIGPASHGLDSLRELVHAGMDVARLNFSHGTHAEHGERMRMIRQVEAECRRYIPIMLDTKGPELRIGRFSAGSVTLEPGASFTITTEPVTGGPDAVSVNYPGLPLIARPGDRLLLDDGLLELEVASVRGPAVVCKVVVGGQLSDRKRISIPGRRLNLPTLSADDKDDLLFGIGNGVDMVAASFMRSAADVQQVKSFLAEHGSSIPVIAKIESREGIENLDSILRVADGLMVARGDLGVELPAEDVPIIQKQMIQKCRKAGKPVITATQMLDSMIRNPSPTRAEVSDVANAVMEGADAVMLSGETATGQYPTLVVQTMSKIIMEVEKSVYDYNREDSLAPQPHSPSFLSDAICYTACKLAKDSEADALVGMTQSGYTAFMLSSYRPKCPLYIFSKERTLISQLSLSWGVRAFYYAEEESLDDIIFDQINILKERGFVKKDDVVINTGSTPVELHLPTNIIKITRVD